MDLESCITQIAIIEKEIGGILRAFDKTPESIPECPCFINFPSDGEFNRHTVGGTRRETHRVKMQLLITRKNLPSDENLLRPFIKKVLDKFDKNIMLNDTCVTSEIERYSYSEIVFGKLGKEVTYLGIEFILSVMIDTTITFA